jgi:secreted PhoX family phosphatase
MTSFNLHRRRLLQRGLVASCVLGVGPGLWGCSERGSPRSAAPLRHERRGSNIPLLGGDLDEVAVVNDPDTRMRIPRGFSVREVARSGQPAVPGGRYAWHRSPDGGATFATSDGGWIYVSNCEASGEGEGGVGALRFDAAGELRDSYSICSGTTRNCAGGATPWGTWLSCEEFPGGLVYECDPSGERPAVVRPALGRFTHEAAAVDPVRRHLYLTEDKPDGNLYRFVPDEYPTGGRASLDRGELQVAVIEGRDPGQSRSIRWQALAEPLPERGGVPTRRQVAGAATFNGGEGCWYHDGIVYFTTKGDNRVWAIDTRAQTLDLVYDKATDRAFEPGINDVDNLTVSAGGDILVAEDGAEMRIVVVGPGVKPFELVNVLGHRGSEITGPAFSPDGSRLYFSSQNGVAGHGSDGRTYELTGPFFASS